MRLLVINFHMDAHSPVLAWQERVVFHLAERCERVVVLTERYVPSPAQPANVIVHVIPVWIRRAPIRWLRLRWLAVCFVERWCRREGIDACFIHMNYEWAYRLRAGFRRLKIPVLLWYAHGAVTWRLRLAHRCVDRVITSTSEGFRIPSTKVRVIGQAIDTQMFVPPSQRVASTVLLYVGRVSRVKRIERMLDVLVALRTSAPGSHFSLRIAGSPLTRADRRYGAELKRRTLELGVVDCVEFLGSLPQATLPNVYGTAFLHINLGQTGSMDKTVLEALACGCPVVTTNHALFEALRDFPLFVARNDDPGFLAGRVLEIYRMPGGFPASALRSLVVGKHDLNTYGERVLDAIPRKQNEASPRCG